VIDLPQVSFQLPPKAGERGRGLVKAFRFGLVMPGGSRIVLDVTGPVRVEKAFVLDASDGQPARLVLDLVGIDREAFLRAAAVDLAFCATLAGFTGRRRKLHVLLGITAVYHVACWSSTGRTLGGMVMRQRVVAIDRSTPTIGQSVVRLFALPIAWALRRPVHDEAAATEVITDSP